MVSPFQFVRHIIPPFSPAQPSPQDGLFEGATCACWDNRDCDSCAARDDCSWCGIENFCSPNDPDLGGGCYGFPEVTTVEACPVPSPCHYIYGDCDTCFAAGCSWCEATGGFGEGGGEFSNFGYCSAPEACFAGDLEAATYAFSRCACALPFVLARIPTRIFFERTFD